MVSADQLDSPFALISMVDSTPRVSELPSLVPLLQRLGRWYSTIGGDVVVEVPTLMALIDDHEFLSGFDEVWLLDELPTSGKPEELRITSDTPLESEVPSGLAEWMAGSSCRAGLGDGDGLNFVTVDPDFASLWRRVDP
jgi:hypothetical protein